jgi:hypothetical protein
VQEDGRRKTAGPRCHFCGQPRTERDQRHARLPTEMSALMRARALRARRVKGRGERKSDRAGRPEECEGERKSDRAGRPEECEAFHASAPTTICVSDDNARGAAIQRGTRHRDRSLERSKPAFPVYVGALRTSCAGVELSRQREEEGDPGAVGRSRALRVLDGRSDSRTDRAPSNRRLDASTAICEAGRRADMRGLLEGSSSSRR